MLLLAKYIRCSFAHPFKRQQMQLSAYVPVLMRTPSNGHAVCVIVNMEIVTLELKHWWAM